MKKFNRYVEHQFIMNLPHHEVRSSIGFEEQFQHRFFHERCNRALWNKRCRSRTHARHVPELVRVSKRIIEPIPAPPPVSSTCTVHEFLVHDSLLPDFNLWNRPEHEGLKF